MTILVVLLFHMIFRANIFSSENPTYAFLKDGIALSASNGIDHFMED